MDFSDALVELVYGKKIHRLCWRDNNYIKMQDNNFTINYPTCFKFNIEGSKFFVEEWLIEDEFNGGYEDKLYPFAIALKHVKLGKKIKLKEWDDQYVKIDQLSKEIIIQGTGSNQWFADTQDILANDWEIYNG